MEKKVGGKESGTYLFKVKNMVLTEELLNIGLTNREADVYLAALQLGYSSVQELAEKAGMNRTTAYTHIKNLICRGLLHGVEKNGRVYYVAERPEKLKFIYEQQERDLRRKRELFDRILPELESIYSLAKEKPFVRYYTHADNLVVLRKEIEEMRADEMYNIFNYAKHADFINKAHIKKILESVQMFKAIYISKNKILDNRLQEFCSDEKFRLRYLPVDKFSFPCEILIAMPRVYIARDEDALLINDKLFAQTLILFFETLWGVAEKF
jgi:sugar-specific transcriptional regulator TrmB